MFLCLGGSRRSTSSGIATTSTSQVHGNTLLDCDQAPGVDRGLVDRNLQRSAPSPSNLDALQALATGKYATSFTRFGASPLPPFPIKLMPRTPSLSDLDPMLMCPIASPYSFITTSGSSPIPTLPPFLPSPSLPSLSSDNESVSEVLSLDRSRFEHPPSVQSRRSQNLVLAKKLKESLGHKFADSLKETIKEVVKRERVEDEVKESGDPWRITQSLEDGLNLRAESGISGKESWSGCWGVENKNGVVHSVDASAIVSATNSESQPNACSGLLGRHGSFPMTSGRSLAALEASPRLEDCLQGSWLPHQNNLPPLAIGELSRSNGPPPQCSWDDHVTRVHENSVTQFCPSGHSSLLDSSLEDISILLKESGSKVDYETHILHRAIHCKHLFPEVAPMLGTGNSSLRTHVDSRFAKEGGESLLDMLNFTGTKRSCESSSSSLVSFADVDLKASEGFRKLSSPSSISQLQEFSGQRFYGKSVTNIESSESSSWQGTGSSSCYDSGTLMKLPGFDLSSSRKVLGVSKLPHFDSDDIDSASVQLSKRQCVELGSNLFEETCSGKPGESTFGFDQYLAALAATERVPSYEIASSPISKFLEEFGHQNLFLPHVNSS